MLSETKDSADFCLVPRADLVPPCLLSKPESDEDITLCTCEEESWLASLTVEDRDDLIGALRWRGRGLKDEPERGVDAESAETALVALEGLRARVFLSALALMRDKDRGVPETCCEQLRSLSDGDECSLGGRLRCRARGVEAEVAVDSA